MDAANPLYRWLFAAGLAAVIGCHSCDSIPIPTVRGQVAGEPVAPTPPAGPLAPIAPTAPTAQPVNSGSVVPTSPFVSGAPVQGMSVVPGSTTSSDPSVRTAGALSALPPAAVRAGELMKDGVLQIKVVALIGASNLVTNQEVIEAVRQRLNEFRDLPGPDRIAKEKELYAAELRRIIERELIIDDMYTKLKKQSRLAMVDEIKEFASKASEQSLRSIRRGYGLKTDEEFESVLRAQGLTQPVIKRQIERQIMADEYVRSAVKERALPPGFAAIRAYYEQNPDEFKMPDTVKWLDLFISFNKHASPQDARAHAERVRTMALPGNGQRDFVALVKEFDNGLASGTNGVGPGSKRGEIQPVDVEPTVWALRVGQVSELIETPSGYHIVKVVEREYAGVRPFDVKVQNQIREKLLRQGRETEYQKLIEELWRKGTVRVIELPE